MNKEIEVALTKALEENLPKQVGETLQKRLAQADSYEKSIKEYIVSLDKAVDKYTTLELKFTELQALKLKKEELEIREQTLILNELKFEVSEKIGESKIKSAEEKVDLMNNLVGLLMKNPQAITSMNANHSYNSSYNPDGSHVAQPTNTFTEIKTDITK